jgi:hypothetical protein
LYPVDWLEDNASALDDRTTWSLTFLVAGVTAAAAVSAKLRDETGVAAFDANFAGSPNAVPLNSTG